MKNKIVRFFVLFGGLGVMAVSVPAQVQQFGQPTFLTATTNSPVLSTATAPVYVPAISLTITATNANTIVTNTLYTVVAYTNITTFVYSAATMGTNFSTNWQAWFTNVPVKLYGNATPMVGGTNNVFIQ